MKKNTGKNYSPKQGRLPVFIADSLAHIDHEDRRQLALKLEDQFFQRGAQAKADTADDTEAAVRLLRENPEMDKLIVGIFSAKAQMT